MAINLLAVFFADVVNGADVGMVQGGSGAGFAAEAFEGLRVAGEVVRKEFEGDMTAEANILRLVDNSHPSAAEFFQDAVMADGFTDHPRSTIMPGMVGCWARESQ